MSNYQPFSTTKNKLAKLWEQNQENTTVIKTSIKTIDTSFLSTQDFKRPQTLTLLDNLLDADSSLYGQEFNVDLTDFPDWAISNSHILVTIATWDIDTANTAPFEITTALPNFQQAFNSGTLVDGGYTLERFSYNYFWQKMADGWKFLFRPAIVIYLVKNNGGNNWSGTPIPLWLTVKLSFSNEKNFNAIQSGK